MEPVTASLPSRAPGARRAARAPLLLLAAEVAAIAALRWRDPHVAGSWGGCPVLALTGRPCPFCGGLRATADLAGGDIARAWSENAMAVLVVPGSLALLLGWLVVAVRGRCRSDVVGERRVVVGVAVVLVAWVAFGVARVCVPSLAWLQP